MFVQRDCLVGVTAWLLFAAGSAPSLAQAQASADVNEAERKSNYASFEKLFTGAKLVGRYTVIGKDNPPAEEEYTILSVKQGEQPDNWFFSARIKYGQRDVVMPPVLLKVKWAGDTPVITLTESVLPGVGTYSARVVIHKNKYAGTWSHGEVGGHLYGVIQPAEVTEQ